MEPVEEEREMVLVEDALEARAAPKREAAVVTQLERNLRGSLFRALMVASMPPLLSQLASSTLVFSDGLIISNTLGASAMASLTYSGTMDFIIRGMAQIFASGSLAVLSTLIGNEQTRDHRDLIPSMLVWLALVMAGVCYALLLPLMRPLYSAIGASGEVLEESISYSRVMILGCPCTILFTIYSSALLGEGLSCLNMIASVVAAGANIGLSYVLVVNGKMGVAGAALGSVLAMALAASICIGMYLFGRTTTRIRPFLPLRYLRESLGLMRRMFVIGTGDAFSYLAYGFIMALFNYFVTQSLPAPDVNNGVAALGAMGRIYGMFSALHLTFGSLGYLPLASYFVGASNREMFVRVTKVTIYVMTAVCLSVSVLLIILSRFIGMLFSRDPTFLYYFRWSIFLCSLTSVLAGYQYIGISFGQALGMSKRLLLASFLCLVVYQPLGILIMYYWFGTYISLIFSYLVNDVLSIITCIVLFTPAYRRLDAVIAEYVTRIEKNTSEGGGGEMSSSSASALPTVVSLGEEEVEKEKGKRERFHSVIVAAECTDVGA